MVRRSSGRYATLTAQLLKRNPHPRCYRCGQPIDTAIKYPDPDSMSLEHIKPVSLYPQLEYDPLNVTLSHLGCNIRAGNKLDIPAHGTVSQQW